MMRISLFAMAFIPALGPIQLPFQWVPRAPSSWVKRSGLEAEHLTPSSAEVRNEWSYTSTHPYVFIERCSIKHRIRLKGVVFS